MIASLETFSWCRYRKPADWGLISEAASSSSVPVIGNGDVLTYYEVKIHAIQNDEVCSET